MKARLRLFAVLGLMLLVSAVPAMATSITDSFSFAPTVTPFTVSSTAIPQFNPGLGTLTSIEIVFSGGASGQTTITNDSSASGTYSFSIATTLELLNPSSSALVSIIPTLDGTVVVPSGGTATSSIFTSPTVDDPLMLWSGFGPYSGSGTYVFDLVGSGVGSFGGPTPFVVTNVSNWSSASGEVIYNFTPAGGSTPEPSSLLFLGSGLALLGLRLRRPRSGRG